MARKLVRSKEKLQDQVNQYKLKEVIVGINEKRSVNYNSVGMDVQVNIDLSNLNKTMEDLSEIAEEVGEQIRSMISEQLDEYMTDEDEDDDDEDEGENPKRKITTYSS